MSALICGVASAQVSPSPKLQRVEPTIEDIDPLHVTLREMQTDLRQPIGFLDVYRVPGNPKLLMRASGGVYAVFPQSVYGWSKKGLMAEVPPGTVYHIGLPPQQPSKEPRPHPDRQLEDGMTASDKSPSESNPLFRFNSRIESRVNTLRDDEMVDQPLLPPDHSRRRERSESKSDSQATTHDEPTQTAETPPSRLALEPPSIISDANYRAQRIAHLLKCAAKACVEASEIGREPARKDAQPADQIKR